MAEGNGSPVTRAELAAHIKGIDESFKEVRSDIREIKDSFREMLTERKDNRRAWLPPLVAATISAAVALPFAFFH